MSRMRTISLVVLSVGVLVSTALPVSAKGPSGEFEQLFVRTTDDGVTVRVSQSDAETGVPGSQPCKGVGCPPRECAPRGQLAIGFSTEVAVGLGWGQLFQRGDQPLHVVSAGIFGWEFGEPAAYVIAQTGDGVASVRVKFEDGAVDEMRPNGHLVVLTARIRDDAVPYAQMTGPSGTIDAFDRDDKRLARDDVIASGEVALPERCFGGLDSSFPAEKGDPPADEDAARAEITFVYATAYGPGLTIEERAALVEDGDALQEVMQLAADKNPQFRDTITAPVDMVVFIDSTHAAVRFSLVIDGNPVISGIGRAVLVDGQWLVARDTYCRLQQLGGVWCPEPED